MKKIALTQNKFALVDDEDYERLNQYKWYFSHYGYAVRPRNIFMHRVILKLIKGQEGDHRDLNTLNNQKFNLRAATRSQNNANHSLQRNNTSGYKGVSFNKRIKRFVAYTKVAGKYIHLGLFDDPILAAKAYDLAAKKYFGEYARLNFI